MRIKSKLTGIGESIFAVMTAVAKKHNAINLSQGFPDFNCSPVLIDLVNKYSSEGYNQYAPFKGVPELRNEIADKTNILYNHLFDPEDEINITAGATQALFTAITALIDSGDEVIIFEPAYDSYSPSIILNKGIPVGIPLSQPEFKIDWDIVRKKINSKTKMVIINSPHNPSGSLIDEEDVKELISIVEKYNLLILSDEVYEHIVFDNKKHISLSGISELYNNVITVCSFGKTFHTTGWKIGYCISNPSIMAEFRKVHQFNVFTVNTPIQYAYAEYLKDSSHYLGLNGFYQAKRDFFIERIKTSKFKFKPAAGTYFQLLDYSEISNKNDMEFSLELAEKYGIAVIPLSPFYSEETKSKNIRICFAKTEKVLEDAANRLCTVK